MIVYNDKTKSPVRFANMDHLPRKRKTGECVSSRNNRLRPQLLRRPRATGVRYYYCPSMLTAIDGIPAGELVTLIGLPEGKKDKFVMVQYNDEEIRVFWEDLRA